MGTDPRVLAMQKVVGSSPIIRSQSPREGPGKTGPSPFPESKDGFGDVPGACSHLERRVVDQFEEICAARRPEEG
jgi:hypothetical protein